MRKNKYVEISLSQEDKESGAFKTHIGGGAEQWEVRGAFQLALMKHLGLKADHRFLDYGCGPIRAGRYFIRHQDRGCYYGYDVNADFIDVAKSIVASTPELSERNPTLRHAPDLLADVPEFDVMLFFSVLQFCGKPGWQKTMDFARKMPKGAVIWITHARWLERLEPRDLAGLEITRVTQEELPADLQIERHGWEPHDRVFPMIGIRRA